MILVGMIGYARVGKDEACKQLGFARCAFADALKAKIDPLFPPNTPKPVKRDTYVAYGEAMRSIDPNHWVKQLVIPDAPKVAVCDCRYVNEAEHVKYELGGTLIWIHRHGVGPANNTEAGSLAILAATQIEIHHVNNNGTPEELADKIRAIIEVK